jgi:hypothetical protein
MKLEKLLALFTAFERNSVDYAIAGGLADLMRGRVTLSEQLEIAVADIGRARSVIAELWPSAELTDVQRTASVPLADARASRPRAAAGRRRVSRRDGSGPSEVRVLPPDTPFYMDIVTRSVATFESLEVRGIPVRVAAVDDRSGSRDVWSRPGFTLRERLAALHALTRELVPPHVLSGVRKYRSIEQASAERERWDNERVAPLRAERLRK